MLQLLYFLKGVFIFNPLAFWQRISKTSRQTGQVDSAVVVVSLILAGIVLGLLTVKQGSFSNISFGQVAPELEPLSADCSGNRVTLSWHRVEEAKYYAIRLDDRTNPWDNNPCNNPGDHCFDNHIGNSLTTDIRTGIEYGWWMHWIDADGVWHPVDDVKPGPLFTCPVASESSGTSWMYGIVRRGHFGSLIVNAEVKLTSKPSAPSHPLEITVFTDENGRYDTRGSNRYFLPCSGSGDRCYHVKVTDPETGGTDESDQDLFDPEGNERNFFPHKPQCTPGGKPWYGNCGSGAMIGTDWVQCLPNEKMMYVCQVGGWWGPEGCVSSDSCGSAARPTPTETPPVQEGSIEGQYLIKFVNHNGNNYQPEDFNIFICSPGGEKVPPCSSWSGKGTQEVIEHNNHHLNYSYSFSKSGKDTPLLVGEEVSLYVRNGEYPDDDLGLFTVTVAAPARENFSFDFPPTGGETAQLAISGEVKECSSGQAVAGANVKVVEIPSWTTTTDVNGDFTMVSQVILPASFTIEVDHSDYFPGEKSTGLIQPSGKDNVSVDVAFSGSDCLQKKQEIPTGETYVFIEPETRDINVSDQTRVDAQIENVSDLYGFDIRLSFNPDLVSVVDKNPLVPGVQIEPGPFLDISGGKGFVVDNTADNSAGTITFAATLLSPSKPVSGSGPLVRITFEGKAEGASSVRWESVLLSDSKATEIPVSVRRDGLIKVHGSDNGARAKTAGADVDGSGEVDILDWTLALSKYGQVEQTADGWVLYNALTLSQILIAL